MSIFADRHIGPDLSAERVMLDAVGYPDLAALAAGVGISVPTGGTDVHLVLVDLAAAALDGRQAEDRLAAVDITVNRNAVPFDPRPPMVASGLRIGTAALATRGFTADAFAEVGDVIARCLTLDDADEDSLARLRKQVREMAARYPLYPGLNGSP